MTSNQLGESRADVETRNEEEESLEAEIPTVEMNLKNPMNKEEQEHEDSGHAVCKSWCAACVEGRGVGRQYRIELLECSRKRKEKEQLRLQLSITVS